MTRGRIAAAAVAILAVIGWWLFGGAPTAPTVPSPEPGTARPAATDSVSPIDTRVPVIDGPKPGPPEAVEGAEPGAPAELPSSEGTCVLEDGTPLPGVQFWSTREVWRETDTARSGADGTFRIHRDEPAVVSHATAVPVSADGGALSERGNGWAVTATSDRLRLTFRDKAGWAHMRLVDADSGNPVTKVAGLRVTWRIPGGTLTMGYGEDQAPGGWIPLPEGRLPESGAEEIRADPSKVEVEFAMPGFEKGRLPLLDIKGRMEIRVRPVPPDAKGIVQSLRVLAMPRKVSSISMPDIATADSGAAAALPVTAHLRWTGPEPAPRHSEVLGMPKESGPFSLYDLPDGPWELEVSATLPDNTVVRGKKAFEKHGGTVELGTIELAPAGRVVIRVVDSAGEPVPQAWAVIVRPEEDPGQGRRLDLNQKGEVAVGDLEPGIGHRVVVKGLPRELEQTVVATADAKPVEFRWNEKLVPCRITLIVDGKAVANPDGRTTIPAVVQESPLPRDKGAWKPDGTFEAKLVPGTYAFSALATPKEGGDLAVFSGEVTVPSGDAFEARLELQRGNR